MDSTGGTGAIDSLNNSSFGSDSSASCLNHAPIRHTSSCPNLYSGYDDSFDDSSDDSFDDSSDIYYSARSSISSIASIPEDQIDYSYDSSSINSSDATSSMVPYNNGTLEIPNARQTSFKIGNVTNLNPQYITDAGTEHLLRQTANVMEDVKCYFDISHTKAWKSVLDTDKIVFLVGFSESFKKLISLKFYQEYKSRVDVFRLNGPEDATICYKRSNPFAIFMEDAFGPLGTEFESISRVIKNLASDENLEAALFMMDPLSFERNKESLKKCLKKRRLADHVVHLEEEEHLLSEDDIREILAKTSEHVKENGRSLTQQDIDKIVCFKTPILFDTCEGFIDYIEEDSQETECLKSPIFFDSCEEFVVYNRHDKNVSRFFSFPLDCLVGDIKYLKEKWTDGYYVLRLVAFHTVFDQSEMGGELAKYLSESIHGNLPQILNQLVGSYLEIQHNEVGYFKKKSSSKKFAFRHRMMQYAVLCTETDKALLIANCPIGYLLDVIAQMTNMREISFEDEKQSISMRFIQEILTGKSAISLAIHKIWNSEEILEDLKRDWVTEERQSRVSILTPNFKSNLLHLAVFQKSPKLLDWVLKTLKVSSPMCEKAIFATCVVGHFEYFKLLMKRMKDVDRLCQSEFEERLFIEFGNTEVYIIGSYKLRCNRSNTLKSIAAACNPLNILDYINSFKPNEYIMLPRGFKNGSASNCPIFQKFVICCALLWFLFVIYSQSQAKTSYRPNMHC